MSKPLRLRTACADCNSAKVSETGLGDFGAFFDQRTDTLFQVRCTGEKAGCCRCRKLNIQCTYPVSMVGRMSRGKRKRHQSDQAPCSNDVHGNFADCFSPDSIDSITCLSNPDTTPSIQCLSPVELFLPHQGVSDDAFEDTRQSQGTLSDYRPLHTDFVFGDTDCQMIKSTSFSPCPDILPPTPECTVLSPSTTTESPLGEETQALRGGRFECIETLSQILQSLETQAQSKPPSIDQILQTTKYSTSNLARVMATEECQTCRCCNMVILSAFDLIVTLFGQIIKVLDDAAPEELPQLRLGAYVPEAGHQEDLVRIVIIKEVKTCTKVLEDLQQCWTSREHQDRVGLAEQWCSRLEQQMHRIISRLEC